jgi:hypothetical protein
MDIPIWVLNSTDWITHESQKVDMQAVNSQPVVQEASEQMKSPRGSHSVCLKAAGAENSGPTASLGHRERFVTMSKRIAGLFVSF